MHLILWLFQRLVHPKIPKETFLCAIPKRRKFQCSFPWNYNELGLKILTFKNALMNEFTEILTFTIALISKVMRVNCLIWSQIGWTEKSWTQYLVIFKKNLDIHKSFPMCIFKLIEVFDFQWIFWASWDKISLNVYLWIKKFSQYPEIFTEKNSTSTVVNQWIVWSGSQNWSEWFVYISYNLKRLNIQWYLLKILTSTIAFLDTFLC